MRRAICLRLRFRSLLRRGAAELELQREFELHVAQQEGENLALGMPPEEARRAALRAFGNAGAAVLGAAALAVSVLPARRAARVEPVESLRRG